MSKSCNKCLVTKELSEFDNAKTCIDGHRSVCKECDRPRKITWRKLHKEYHYQKTQEWREGNRDKISAYTKKKTLDGTKAFSLAKYRSTKLQATAKWGNEFFIQEAYRLAALRTKVFGYPWHVDHIVPLQGRIVCGLHVENNLQVIPGKDNNKKSNKWLE